ARGQSPEAAPRVDRPAPCLRLACPLGTWWHLLAPKREGRVGRSDRKWPENQATWPLVEPGGPSWHFGANLRWRPLSTSSIRAMQGALARMSIQARSTPALLSSARE